MIPSLTISRREKMNYDNIDFNKVWQETMGWNSIESDDRKSNDAVEQAFWDKIAPLYTKEYNLNNDTDLLKEKMLAKIDNGGSVLEIGPGTGNFTVFLAKKGSHVLGIDFSYAMIRELQKRLLEEKIYNVQLHQGKWEEYDIKSSYDYIVSVNSLYRIQDMEYALTKMYACCNKGLIIVRTIQRPFLYEIYKKYGINVKECLDYQLMPILFWKKGIHADVEYVQYNKKVFYKSTTELKKLLETELSEDDLRKYGDSIFASLLNKALFKDGGLYITQPRISVIISTRK